MDQENQSILQLVQKCNESLDCINLLSFEGIRPDRPPPDIVLSVLTGILNLLKSNPMVPTDKKGNIINGNHWKILCKIMNDPKRFIQYLKDFQSDISGRMIFHSCFDKTAELIKNPDINKESVSAKSIAAAYLYEWQENIYTYYQVTNSLEPILFGLEQSKQELQSLESDFERNKTELSLKQHNKTEFIKTLELHEEAKSKVKKSMKKLEKYMNYSSNISKEMEK